MTTAATPAAPPRAGVLAAAALVGETVDELVLGTVRDVHGAVARRAHRLVGNAAGVGPVAARVHDGVATAVYAGLGTGLRTVVTGLRAADRRGYGTRLEDSPRGRFTVAAVNGLIGDRLAEEHPGLAIEMAVRRGGRDVPLTRPALAEAFPGATGDVAVLLHGLGENDDSWDRHRDRVGTTYDSRLAGETGWTPVRLRANTGLPIAENGVALASLLADLTAAWPVEVRRIALVGHSMGGLIMRTACAVDTRGTSEEVAWSSLVTHVVTLGTPHLGAPLERVVDVGARALGVLPESAPFGRILEYRSVGILDLRQGLPADVRHLPHARYHLVAATLAESPRHPVSEVLGDLLVRYPSAVGHARRGRPMFPGAEVLHVPGADHFDLLNHLDVGDALVRWLG